MLAASLLAKKRDGKKLSEGEIRFLVEGFCRGEVADYQMTALAMAICVRGMDADEIVALTRAMWESGQSLVRPTGSERPRVDKHSTGGIGDKVSLILAPLLACCEVDVPMISGRGLGITGGTLDKLESIDGFRTQMSDDESRAVLDRVGAFIVGASEHVAPADRRLYALRDVTGTVESVPLITASILSKKLSASLDALVMDVKVGSGAFMKTQTQAVELAETIMRVGTDAGLPTTALLTDMDQPLGNAIGNAIEVNEACDVLAGKGPAEVRELTIELSASLLVQTKMMKTLPQARKRLADLIDSGAAMERFEQMVVAQGGAPEFPRPLASGHMIVANRGGFLVQYQTCEIGRAVVEMGGGRRRAGDAIDPAVGIQLHASVGDHLQQGQPVMTVYRREMGADAIMASLEKAISIADHPLELSPLVLRRW